MDIYPHHYVAHNVPLVTLFGLETPAKSEGAEDEQWYPGFHENGFSFTSELPPIEGPAAESLRQAFRDLDAKDAAWNSRPGPRKMGSMGFTYRNTGRTMTLPPHKAPPPPQSDLEDLPSSWQLVLHSPISPLTPTSKLYPDGILSPVWASKHQSLIPSAVICFFTFTVDPSRSSLEDNALKQQINQFKAWKAETKYATRVVVVLVCDEAAPVSAVVERLGNIRRSTNLDTKTLLYMPGGLSVDETRAFVGSLLSNIHPACIEYYRDLSKHARRKKNRGSIPQPTIPPTSGTSQTLSARGWNVRYEVKLGVFAEFRGEMDAAERNYEQAYEDLMDGDVFEGISNWSPRFNEARMLADVLAIRILRCLLWTNQTTSASQSWANHKYRMQEIIDKKGKGSNTYAWQAWEATWSRVMAQLIERVEIPYFHIPKPTEEMPVVTPNIFAPPERTLTLSKESLISPWDHLHHPGYWYARSARRLQSRRVLAGSIPAEDRRPPGESPASALVNRSHLYDNYMVPDPHEEFAESIASTGLHSTLLIDAFGKAIQATEERQESRTAEKLKLSNARELMGRGQWAEAASLLRSMFETNSYVRENWWVLWQDVLLLASQVGAHLKDGQLLLLANWQLQSTWHPLSSDHRPSLTKSIKALDLASKPKVSFNVGSSVPVIGTTISFGDSDTCVGDALKCQLVLMSHAHTSVGTLTLAYIDVHCNESSSVTKVRLEHDANSQTVSGTVVGRPKVFQSIELNAEEGGPIFVGNADLSVEPNGKNIYEFSIVPVEAQPLSVTAIHCAFENDDFDLQIVQTVEEPRRKPLYWWKPGADGVFARYPLYLDRYRTIDVKPRPPKLEITFPDHQEVYYTDKRAAIKIRTINAESEQADVRLKVRLLNPNIAATVHWVDGKRESNVLVGETGVVLPQRDLGTMEAATTQDVVFSIEQLAQMTDVVVDVEAVYTLVSKPNTIITKSVRQKLPFVRAFEANYEAFTGVHPAQWPSYFELPDDKEPAGITQRSYVMAKIACFAKEPLTMEHVALVYAEPADPSVVATIESTEPPTVIDIQPSGETNHKFRIDAQKYDLDDRAQASLPLALAITWRRKTPLLSSASFEDSQTTTTTIAAPPITFDFSKPRALASARISYISSTSSNSPPTPVVHMTYTLENPSDFILTFGVTMDTSDQFAFAGPKATSLQLTPFSRADVRFTLLPLLRGGWIAPVVKVNDLGFKETLRVGAAEGVRAEKGRCLVWVPGDDKVKGEGYAKG